MKIGVAGTGAVGGYFGTLLQRAGHEVVFLARGKNLEKMQSAGLTVITETGTFNGAGTFTDVFETFSDVDLVLFCVKSTQTKETAEKLYPILKKDSLVLTFQNGVDNEEILAAIFGKERIVSVATYIQASLEQPGVVRQIGTQPRLILGGLDESIFEKAKEISALFNEAEIETFSAENILELKWKKLLWNVTFNPLTALLETKVGAIFDNVGLLETAVKICQEAIAVAKADGIEIEDNFYETVLAQGQFAKDHYTSMLQDKLNGKAMEIESIGGYIVKKGREMGVAAPVLETIYHLLKYQETK